MKESRLALYINLFTNSPTQKSAHVPKRGLLFGSYNGYFPHIRSFKRLFCKGKRCSLFQYFLTSDRLILVLLPGPQLIIRSRINILPLLLFSSFFYCNPKETQFDFVIHQTQAMVLLSGLYSNLNNYFNSEEGLNLIRQLEEFKRYRFSLEILAPTYTP